MILITYAYKDEISVLKRLVQENDLSQKVAFQRVTTDTWAIKDDVELILNVGFAGALNSKLALGQVVFVEKVMHLEQDKLLTVELDKIDNALEGISSAALLTSKEAITSVLVRDELREKTGADIVDMEAFELFKKAKEEGIPFVSLKAVSDMADSEAWQMIKQNKKRWAEALGHKAFGFLKTIENSKH